jgi:channel protein (hemolysin III family)
MDPGTFTPWLGISDPVAAGTHLLGAIASLAGSVQLWRRTPGDLWRRFTVSVFTASMFLLFCASTAYHTAFPGPLKLGLRHFDHASIYVLIAGTFTPIVGNLVRGSFRTLVLGTVWSLAVAGVVLKLFFFDSVPEWLDTTIYLSMGWFGVVPFFRIWRDHGALRPVLFILAPALTYSAGAVCELYGWPVIVEHVFGFHEVFHVCVLVASALFYLFVLEHVTPVADPAPRFEPARDEPDSKNAAHPAPCPAPAPTDRQS